MKTKRRDETLTEIEVKPLDANLDEIDVPEISMDFVGEDLLGDANKEYEKTIHQLYGDLAINAETKRNII